MDAMKKSFIITTAILVIVLSLATFFLAGCQTTSYVFEDYEYGALIKRIVVKNNKCCVNTETANLDIAIDPNGRATLSAGKIIVIADPNSAKAIGEAIGVGLRAAAGLK
jgi:hypothetical protein